jgi:alkyl hydroperoxide reductase subunit F
MFDLIIIGGSAAAASAGIYAARRGLNFKIITKDFGGEVATSGEVDNYPGIPDTNGIELAAKFKQHLADYKVEPEEGVEVERITRQDDGTFCITAKKDGSVSMAVEKLPDGQDPGLKCDYVAKAVIIATGVHPRELNVTGEKEFRNKGVSYCTVCDGPIFAGKTVAVVGGGNSALEAGLMMADISNKVYMINKNPEFKGDVILLDNLKAKKNVEFIYSALTSVIEGEQFVTGLKYKQGEEEKDLKVDGIFVHIGMLPNSKLVPNDIKKNEFGEIIVDKNCQTSVPGLYAAGDVTDIPFKQIVLAAAQGTCALLSAVQYLNKSK